MIRCLLLFGAYRGLAPTVVCIRIRTTCPIFSQFLDGDLWDKIFKQKSLPSEEATLRPFTDSIVNDLNFLLDEGSI